MHRRVWFKDDHSEKSIIENETRKPSLRLYITAQATPSSLRMPLVYQNSEHYDCPHPQTSTATHRDATHRAGLLAGGAFGIPSWGVSKHLAACPQGCTSRKPSVSSCSHPSCLISGRPQGPAGSCVPFFNNFSFLFPYPCPRPQ